jgi:hypothetical protein
MAPVAAMALHEEEASHLRFTLVLSFVANLFAGSAKVRKSDTVDLFAFGRVSL